VSQPIANGTRLAKQRLCPACRPARIPKEVTYDQIPSIRRRRNRRVRSHSVGVCRPDAGGELLLREASERFGWSARAYYRVLKVARTIADLAGDAMPNSAHVAEAIQYRRVASLS